jgi:acetyltransferase-like isoleucine patch superfamily enzyme
MPSPKRARVVTWASLRWVVLHRAWTPYHLVRYLRYARLRLTRPHVITEGMVFLGKGVDAYAGRGYGRLVIGKFAHIGDHTALRAHEGTVRIGDKAVLGARVTVNSYLHVEIGPTSLIGDDTYICDFDHRYERLDQPIKDQGIVKAPVRIGRDVWLGTKATVLRGVDVGEGCVVGAGSVVTHDLPPYSVAAGAPARVLKSRLPTMSAAPIRPTTEHVRRSRAHWSRRQAP